MIEHLSNSEIERYRRGDATPAEMLTLDDHLAICEACRARAATMARAETQVASLASGYRAVAAADQYHLDYEELAVYVDGGLEEVGTEIIRSHLAICPECAREERDLRDFKSVGAPNLKRQYAPAVAAPVRTPRWRWEEILQAYKAWLLAWRMAAAAALLLVAGAAVWLSWQAQRNDVGKVEPPKTRTDGDGAPSPAPPASPDAEALIALNDGAGKVSLTRQGQLIGLEWLPSSAQTAIKTALAQQKAAPEAALSELGGNDGALMSGQPAHGEFDVLEPRGKVVEDARPNFRWRGLAGATSYTVKVFDQNFNLVAQSPALAAGAWRPAKPLARGAIYSWQVTALKDGKEIKAPRPPAPQAEFKVLDAGASAELREARRQEPVSHLALGVLYARAGLLDGAERELSALLQANPQSDVARKLLAGVRAARRVRQ